MYSNKGYPVDLKNYFAVVLNPMLAAAIAGLGYPKPRNALEDAIPDWIPLASKAGPGWDGM